jgi:hypothetical protein
LIVLNLHVLIWSPFCNDIRMIRLKATPKSSSRFSPWNRTTKRAFRCCLQSNHADVVTKRRSY